MGGHFREGANPRPRKELLDVYAVAIDFHRHVSGMALARGQGVIRDQLGRASLSIVLNIAEGAGRFSPRDKARFYAIAHGSACECAAVLDVLQTDCDDARVLLARIVRMLSGLIARMKGR